MNLKSGRQALAFVELIRYDMGMTNQHSDLLRKVQLALMQMHRYLMNSLKTDRENQVGHAIQPTEWFHLILSDPEFTWLRSASGLMADIDALMDNFTVTEEQLKIIRQELESMFLTPSENPKDFNSLYNEIVKKDSDVMLYHGHLRQLIKALPVGSPQADTSEIRKSWHQKSPKHST